MRVPYRAVLHLLFWILSSVVGIDLFKFHRLEVIERHLRGVVAKHPSQVRERIGLALVIMGTAMKLSFSKVGGFQR